MKTIWAVLGMLSAAVCGAADPVPVTLNAVLSMGAEQRFGLATENGARSAWLTLGSEFEGYTLKSYDPTAQVLTLEREGESFPVSIAGGSVKTLDAKATVAQATDVLNQMKFEQMLEKMIDQQKQAMVGMSKQMMGQMAGQVSQEDFAAFQSKIMDLIWAEMKPAELKGDIAKIYSELFTADELKAMSAFYGTPAGTSLIEKQPEMQQRMMQVMMPRMMRAMPKVQQLSQEFARQQAAKMNPAPTAPATSSSEKKE